MSNKILLVSAFALGLSSVAFAGGLPCETCAMPPAPCAVCGDTGIYIGIEGGYGMTNWSKTVNSYFYDPTELEFEQIAGVDDSNGLVGRAFIGYDIDKYFALEGGYTQFGTKRTHINEEDGTIFSFNTNAIDLELKIKAPITDEINLYAKIGADYLMTSARVDPALQLSDRKNFNVLFGAGADYCITPNIIVNAEWMRYNGNPDLSINGTDSWYSNYQPYADAFMVGIRYRFDI